MITEEVLSNPFPGLRPFQEDEGHLFFGREDQIDELMRRLRRYRFLAVVGTSGSGKSSLVRAGLLPSLYRGFMTQAGSSWRVAILRPGNSPIFNLAEALSQTLIDGSPVEDIEMHQVVTETMLRRGALGLIDVVQKNPMPTQTNLLVVVDQFEELFRFKQRAQGAEGVDAADEAAAFVKLLLAAIRQDAVPIYGVLTMRSDFLGDCAQFRDLPEAMNDSQYLIPRMTRDQKRRAIEGPVAVCRGQMTPRLVSQLLNDVGDNPDQLPVLQHALMRTWEKWTEDLTATEGLDLTHYQAIGGMAKALSDHADDIYDALPEERDREIAKKLFQCLTEKGVDNRGVRRPTPLSEICAVAEASPAEIFAIVEAFRAPGKSLLMPPVGDDLTEDTMVDLSHESLMRVWGQLQTWVEDEAQSAQTYCRLADTAIRYQHGTAAFLQNPDLSIIQSWCQDHPPNQAWANRYDPEFELAMQFLQGSLLAAEQAERQQKRQRRWSFIVLGSATFFSSLVALFAVYQLQRAELQRMGQYEATTKLLAHTNPVEGLMNGIAAVGLGRSNVLKFPQLNQSELVTEDILLSPSNQVLSKVLRGHEGRVLSVGFSPDGQSIVSGSSDQTVRLWDLEGNPIGQPFQGHESWVLSVGFGPDGQSIVSGSDDQTVRLWDLEGNPIGQPFQGHESRVLSVGFSPDGQSIVSGSDDQTVRLWDLEGNPIGQPFQGHEGSVLSVGFSPDGQSIVSGSFDQSVRLWDLEGNPIGQPFQGHEGRVWSVGFSPDGQSIVSGSSDQSVRLWDLEGNPIGQPFQGHEDWVLSVGFSPDGQSIVSGSDDQSVTLGPRGQPHWPAVPGP